MRSSTTRKRATPPKKRGSCSAAAGSGAGGVGVLGGIFDPVHNGHIALAACAMKYFQLSRVLFVPAGLPPHKKRVGASPGDRLAMLCLALRSEPAFSVWDGELRRGGISYTIDTVLTLSREPGIGKIHFIVGSDNLVEIPSWRRFRDVLARVVLCVAHRPGHPGRIPGLLHAGSIETFPSPEVRASSTMIRERIARGRTIRGLVPKEVAEYISINKLYVKQ